MSCRPIFSQRSSYSLQPLQSKNSSRLVCFSMSVLLKTCWSFHIWFLLGSRNCHRSHFSTKEMFSTFAHHEWWQDHFETENTPKVVWNKVGRHAAQQKKFKHCMAEIEIMLAFGWLTSQKSPHWKNEPFSKVTSHFSCAARWSTSLLVTLDHNRQQMDTLIMNFGVHR